MKVDDEMQILVFNLNKKENIHPKKRDLLPPVQRD
jgi:hypothetical protein